LVGLPFRLDSQHGDAPASQGEFTDLGGTIDQIFFPVHRETPLTITPSKDYTQS
jgi:hypothetical protein